jgi:hypothetical protein
MACTSARAVVIGDQNGASIVFTHRCGLSEGRTEIGENLPKVLDNLSYRTASDGFGFGLGEGGCLMNACFGKNCGAAKENDRAGNKAMLPNIEKAGRHTTHQQTRAPSVGNRPETERPFCVQTGRG